ncbi:heparan sulfate 2-O-sulfotransferase, putative [Ixodes scapularis]|uniref:Heparan sulfate 2-O-sulfotransferase, putative n=1 Tax=Ixodes scapularis TaxID=6945 RepID=B7PL23_IXOSC|nr:heparan sulfate 2-O-sulfotransferase, putative [Ixodes scapularis]|eukprot:XP_002434471.1 heparan sulfate 2-O-sulfotransferase, putative [Ixodes scapularis]
MDAEERFSGHRLKRTLHCVIAVLLGASLLWFFSGRQEVRDAVPPPPCPQRPAAERAASARLLYNRVPKCGSTTLVHLLRRLSKSNGFSHVHSKTYNQRLLSPEQQAQFVRDMSAAPAPYSHDRHIYFVDFGQFGRPSPAYVNVIRDPVDRLVSSFYYRRATHRSLMMPYFCGHDVRCTTVGDPWALRTAMEHVDRHFVVVGVLEDMNATLALLERRLPAFFRGALQLYRQFVEKDRHRGQQVVRQCSFSSAELKSLPQLLKGSTEGRVSRYYR